MFRGRIQDARQRDYGSRRAGRPNSGNTCGVSRKKLSPTICAVDASRARWSAHALVAAVGARRGTGRTPASRSRPSRTRREPAALGARAEPPARISVAAAQPQLVRRHRLRRVLVQQRGQRVDVVALERVDVAVEQLAVGDAERLQRHVVGASDPSPPAWPGARCSALFTDATVVSSSSATSVGLPAQHLAQDQHGALPRRQVLEGGDERQPDRLRAATASSAGSRADGTAAVGHRLASSASRRGAARACVGGARARPDPSAGPGAGWPSACRSTRWWRCGTATSAARRDPRTGRSSATRAPASPAPRPRPRRPSRACGSSTPSARPGAPRAAARWSRSRASTLQLHLAVDAGDGAAADPDRAVVVLRDVDAARRGRAPCPGARRTARSRGRCRAATARATR